MLLSTNFRLYRKRISPPVRDQVDDTKKNVSRNGWVLSGSKKHKFFHYTGDADRADKAPRLLEAPITVMRS